MMARGCHLVFGPIPFALTGIAPETYLLVASTLYKFTVDLSLIAKNSPRLSYYLPYPPLPSYLIVISITVRSPASKIQFCSH